MTADLLTAWAAEMEVLVLGWYVIVETARARTWRARLGWRSRRRPRSAGDGRSRVTATSTTTPAPRRDER